MEKGFLVYLALMKSFGFNYFMFVFFSVFIDVLLVDRFIQRFCPNYALAMLLFVYVYCNAEINLQRNMKSIVLFLYSLQYVEQKKIIPFMALNLLGLTFHFSAIFYILSYWLFRIPIGRSVYIILVLLLNAVYFFKINLLGDLITLVAGWVGGKAEVVAEIYTNSSITREAGVSAVRCPGNHSGTYPAGRVAVGNRPYHGFAYGRSLHRSAHGGAAQRDDRSEQRADRLCPLLACRQPRPDYRPWSGGSGAHPLYLTLFSNNTDFMKRVIGIGNALTDMLVNLKTDKVLDTFNLPKGSMSLVDAALQTEISKSVAGLPYSLSLGGSAGNTIRAMARLGCDVGFIGKVGTDKTGDFFIQALENLGIEPFIFRGKERSGRCVSLISPDGERTMVTFLGAALELSAAEVTSAIFEGYDCLYIEGYLVQDHELIAGAVRTAKACGLKVAIDLASFNVVEANLEFLRSLIQDYVDIVFANEDEAKAFTGEGEPLNALQMLSELCELAVVKVGIKGALIKRGSEVVHVGIMAAAKRVDTTGAGDLYAAGFLSGLCEGLTLRQCGTIGAIVAGKVIEVVGTTFSEEAWQHAFQLVEKVRSEKYLF